MEKNKPARRDFIKLSALALGGFTVAPLAGIAQKTARPIIAIGPGDKKLRIVCVAPIPATLNSAAAALWQSTAPPGTKLPFYTSPGARQATPPKLILKWPHYAQKKLKLPAKY